MGSAKLPAAAAAASASCRCGLRLSSASCAVVEMGKPVQVTNGISVLQSTLKRQCCCKAGEQRPPHALGYADRGHLLPADNLRTCSRGGTMDISTAWPACQSYRVKSDMLTKDCGHTK